MACRPGPVAAAWAARVAGHSGDHFRGPCREPGRDCHPWASGAARGAKVLKLELSSQRQDALRSVVRQAAAVVLVADGRWVDPALAKGAEPRAPRVSALRVQNSEEP